MLPSSACLKNQTHHIRHFHFLCLSYLPITDPSPFTLHLWPQPLTVSRLATNNGHFMTAILGITDPIHRQKISLKAMDVVLFGPPKRELCALDEWKIACYDNCLLLLCFSPEFLLFFFFFHQPGIMLLYSLLIFFLNTSIHLLIISIFLFAFHFLGVNWSSLSLTLSFLHHQLYLCMCMMFACLLLSL